MPDSSPTLPEPRHRGAALVAVLSIIALLLHLAWELAQCRVFFVHGTYDPSWRGMLMAAFGDVVMTWLVYGVVAVTSRRWRSRQWASLLATSLVVAGVVEWRGVNAGRWRYTEAMLVVPGLGIGVVPLIQLLALTALLVALSEALVQRGWEGRRSRRR